MKDDRLYLNHILEAIERIQLFTSAGSAIFESDLKTQDAVIRNLQVIGEASKKLSPGTRAASPHIPWQDIVGMRDRIVHDYFGVSLAIVWDVVENHLPLFEGRSPEAAREGLRLRFT